MASHMQAMKRLAKEARAMEDSPPPFISAAPIDDDDLFTWRAILSGVPGTPLEGTAIVVELTFPTDFPKNAPNAGFCTPIPYSMGGSWNNAKGQQVLCLRYVRACTNTPPWARQPPHARHGSSPWSHGRTRAKPPTALTICTRSSRGTSIQHDIRDSPPTDNLHLAATDRPGLYSQPFGGRTGVPLRVGGRAGQRR